MARFSTSGCLDLGIVSILSAGLWVAPVAAQTPATPVCGNEPSETVSVAAVRDARSLMLADGREVRLAAIETPDGDQAAVARSALEAWAGGHPVVLRRLSAGLDRYGRIVAFAFPADGADRSAQQALLEAGLAQVGVRAGGKPCADSLLAAERTAREARHGLWADPNFAPLQADDLAAVAAKRGRFAMIEGKVLSVRESGSTTYINFGRRWTRDFTVTILRHNRRVFTAALSDLKNLQGRRIRVRGWVEQRAGPIIEAMQPEQIELLAD